MESSIWIYIFAGIGMLASLWVAWFFISIWLVDKDISEPPVVEFWDDEEFKYWQVSNTKRKNADITNRRSSAVAKKSKATVPKQKNR